MNSSSAQFTTRARVVDLLGREQIADAPTAMGEIFKNAMDAGASNVTVDYWPKQRCLIVGDDGLGMRTEEELLGKWLVLATDSKQQSLDTKASWLKHADQDQRARLTTTKAFGKKGIGRLAIALLGGATLVWTRWGKGRDMQRTLMLVHWTVFRHPYLTLDEIKIPFLVLDRAATVADAKGLFQQALQWVETSPAFNKGLTPHLKAQVLEELTNVFPESLKAGIDFPDEHGTQFVILGTEDMVANHFEGWLGRDNIWEGEETWDVEGPKAYLAFGDPFTLQSNKRLQVRLLNEGREVNRSKGEFWTLADLKKGDHSLDLVVNEDGFVAGQVRRFSDTIDFEWQIPELPSRSQRPGTFRLRVGYLEGDQAVSRLNVEDFNELYRRVRLFGGFYVYMDGVRICPYGRLDVDFVGFERRRLLNAGRYFFSQRRMFGAVSLTQKNNSDLVEKAGREGFQQNAAYRGLVYCLEKVFVHLADTYFGKKAEREDKVTKKQEELRKRREARQQAQRKEFQKNFSSSVRKLPSQKQHFDIVASDVAAAVKRLELDANAKRLEEARELQDELRSTYAGLWAEMVRAEPGEFELEPDDVEALDGYLHKLEEADRASQRTLASLAERIDKVAVKIEKAAARASTLRRILEGARDEMWTELVDASSAVQKTTEHLKKEIAQKPQADLDELDSMSTKDGASESEPDTLAAVEEFVAQQRRLLRGKFLPFYERVTQQLNLIIEGDSDLIEAADLRNELRLFRERESQLMELAQFGLVLESADHDFHARLNDSKKAFGELEKACPPALKPKLQQVKDYVQFIDERLQGLDPLVRRVRGRVSEISGEDIRSFVQHSFDETERAGVKFEYTKKFLESMYYEVKRPVFLGAVHNLVMNAGYWASKGDEPKSIRFSVHPQGFVISDSGPGVHSRDRDRIFDPGFSRRPAGRGLGLYIARSCLRSFDYDIELLDVTSTSALKGANFLIRRPIAKA